LAADRLARSAASAGIATLTSRVLGVVREQVLASLFGAGDAMDAYNVAFRVPNLLRDLFAEGAMSAAFVPTFTHQLTAVGKASAWRLGRNVMTALLLVTGVLVLAGMVFADQLVSALASDYAAVPGKLQLTSFLARIMLPTIAFIALAAAAMGMLNALHHFFIPALAPATFNVATILCAIALVPVAPRLGLPPVAAIAIGTLLGAAAQFLIQWPTLRREGFHYRPLIDLHDPALRRVLVLMGPGTIGLAATQANVFINTILATGQGTGAVSWLNYAFRLMYLPIGLFGVSIATAVLPAVSRRTAQRDHDGVRRTVSEGMSLMMVLNVPATVGLVILATPIIRLIFERRAFTPLDTAATAAALQFYAVGLIGYSIVRIVSPVFYALGQNRTPVMVSIATVGVNIVSSVALVRPFGYRGLALATSIAALFNAATLLVLLHRRLRGLDDARTLASVGRILIASAVMGAAALAMDRATSALIPGAQLASQIARLAITIGCSLVVLAVAAWVLRIREFTEAMALVTRRFHQPPSPTNPA
jgi:putative peptidoglycan lipid II flippase